MCDGRRLQLGASRLEKLNREALKVFLDKSWVHLGDETSHNPHNRPLVEVDYEMTNFQPFYFSQGTTLPFSDNCFSHIFSEHFFEHLFLGEAIELFRECHRVLCPNGVIRTVVPDADLRPIPEVIGFPGDHVSYNCSSKHKTRWSFYSLRPILELCGFRVVPVRYYDAQRNLVETDPSINQSYEGCLDRPLIATTSHIKRKDSLILDGVKDEVRY